MARPYAPLRFYIASRFQDRDDAIGYKYYLQDLGLECTSTWLTDQDGNGTNMATLEGKNEECRQRASADFKDIADADIFIVLSPRKAHGTGSGGRHVEVGYAVALGKPVFLLGHRENVFHYLPQVRVVPDVGGLLYALGLGT